MVELRARSSRREGGSSGEGYCQSLMVELRLRRGEEKSSK